MNKEAIKKWTDALRSGNYKQGTGALKVRSSEEVRYCCLGVACEVFKDEVNLSELDPHPNYLSSFISFDHESYGLPNKLSDHLNIDFSPFVYIKEHPIDSIAGLNDTGELTFEQLADIIDNGFQVPDHLVDKVSSLYEH